MTNPKMALIEDVISSNPTSDVDWICNFGASLVPEKWEGDLKSLIKINDRFSAKRISMILSTQDIALVRNVIGLVGLEILKIQTKISKQIELSLKSIREGQIGDLEMLPEYHDVESSKDLPASSKFISNLLHLNFTAAEAIDSIYTGDFEEAIDACFRASKDFSSLLYEKGKAASVFNKNKDQLLNKMAKCF